MSLIKKHWYAGLLFVVSIVTIWSASNPSIFTPYCSIVMMFMGILMMSWAGANYIHRERTEEPEKYAELYDILRKSKISRPKYYSKEEKGL